MAVQAVALPKVTGVFCPVRVKLQHCAGHKILLLPAQGHKSREVTAYFVRIVYIRGHFRHKEGIALMALVDADAALAACEP